MTRQIKHLYVFDKFRVDVAERVLFSNDEIIPLTSKAFDVLLALVERRGQIITKAELMQRVWPDSFVEESNITQNIYTLRKVMGQMADGQGYIRTAPRRGYYFAADVGELWVEQPDEDISLRERSPDDYGRTVEAVSSVELNPESGVASPEPGILDAQKESEAGLIASLSQSEVSQSRSFTGGLKRHRKAAVIFVTLILIGTVAAGLWVSRFGGRENLKSAPAGYPSNMTVTALTATGNVDCATVSPDGNFVVYATADKPQLSSLWIEQPSTSTRRAILPPAEIRYHALTFSPDGNYIYYVALTKDSPGRTLYRVSILGGQANVILNNVETAISFSPDGSRFAFRRILNESRKAALFIADKDGSSEKEVAALRFPESLYDPAWSPDGKVIACAAGNAEGVTSMYVAGVSTEDWTMKPISDHRWQWVGQVAWLAGASGLVMVAKERAASPIQVWRLSHRGGEVRRVTNDSNRYNRLSISTDGRVIVALQSKQVSNIWMIPAGDAPRASQITLGAGGYRGELSWTPGGKIIFESEKGHATTISMMDADGGNPKQLTGDLTGHAYVGRPMVSPDGRHVVFTSDLSGERHIWRMNIDGSNLVQLTNGSGEDNPYCSPDGNWLAYTQLERSGAGMPTVQRMSIEGGEIVQMTDAFTAYPAISPDGKMFACLYSKTYNDPWRIAVYSFDGGQPVKVFPQPVLAQTVRWTPDGRGLTYAENPVAGSSKIWIQPLDSHPPRLLAEIESDRIFGFDWSRDGKYLACVRGLWTMNVVLIKDFE